MMGGRKASLKSVESHLSTLTVHPAQISILYVVVGVNGSSDSTLKPFWSLPYLLINTNCLSLLICTRRHLLDNTQQRCKQNSACLKDIAVSARVL